MESIQCNHGGVLRYDTDSRLVNIKRRRQLSSVMSPHSFRQGYIHRIRLHCRHSTNRDVHAWACQFGLTESKRETSGCKHRCTEAEALMI